MRAQTQSTQERIWLVASGDCPKGGGGSSRPSGRGLEAAAESGSAPSLRSAGRCGEVEAHGVGGRVGAQGWKNGTARWGGNREGMREGGGWGRGLAGPGLGTWPGTRRGQVGLPGSAQSWPAKSTSSAGQRVRRPGRLPVRRAPASEPRGSLGSEGAPPPASGEGLAGWAEAGPGRRCRRSFAPGSSAWWWGWWARAVGRPWGAKILDRQVLRLESSPSAGVAVGTGALPSSLLGSEQQILCGVAGVELSDFWLTMLRGRDRVTSTPRLILQIHRKCLDFKNVLPQKEPWAGNQDNKHSITRVPPVTSQGSANFLGFPADCQL